MLVNKQTKKWLDAYISRPKAALLLNSPDDITSTSPLIQYVHSELIGSRTSPLITINSGDKKSIGVEEIRFLKKKLSLAANSSKNEISRIIHIEQAEMLTPEAQNAMLKLIEELPARTLVCLSTAIIDDILPTILSRCFQVPVLPITQEDALKFAVINNVDKKQALRSYALSEGKSSVYISLINGRATDLTDQIDQAKQYLSASIFDRQKYTKILTTKDHDVGLFISCLKIVAKSGMRNSKEVSSKLRWKENLVAIVRAEYLLGRNVSLKLVLLNLSSSLG